MQYEGDDVTGAEDPEVLFSRDGGSVRGLEVDKTVEDIVDACCEEGGVLELIISWHGCFDYIKARGESLPMMSVEICIREAGFVVVRADGTAGTACPADDFSHGADCEYLCRCVVGLSGVFGEDCENVDLRIPTTSGSMSLGKREEHQ